MAYLVCEAGWLVGVDSLCERGQQLMRKFSDVTFNEHEKHLEQLCGLQPLLCCPLRELSDDGVDQRAEVVAHLHERRNLARWTEREATRTPGDPRKRPDSDNGS